MIELGFSHKSAALAALFTIFGKVVYVHVYMYVCMYVCIMCVYLFVYVCLYIYVCVYVCVYVCMYVYMYVCVCICVCGRKWLILSAMNSFLCLMSYNIVFSLRFIVDCLKVNSKD